MYECHFISFTSEDLLKKSEISNANVMAWDTADRVMRCATVANNEILYRSKAVICAF